MNARKLRTLAIAAIAPAALAATALLGTATPAEAGPSESTEYYSVELTGDVTYTDHEYYGIYTVPAKVCVLQDNPTSVNGWSKISMDPWEMVIEGDPDEKTIKPWEGLESEPGDGDFPASGSYRVGQCAEGDLPFRKAGDVEIENNEVVWDSGLGQVETFSLGDA